MADSEYVLVKSREGDGAHFPVLRSIYDAFRDEYDLLKSDPLDHNGQPKPVKYAHDFPAETKSGPAASDGPKADTSKEK